MGENETFPGRNPVGSVGASGMIPGEPRVGTDLAIDAEKSQEVPEL